MSTSVIGERFDVDDTLTDHKNANACPVGGWGCLGLAPLGYHEMALDGRRRRTKVPIV